MKAKLSKKLLSIGLSVLMAVSVLPLSLISTNAVTCNIKISNITYPRPDAKPDHNIKYSGNLKYELLGTVWSSDNDSISASIEPKEFENFYKTLFGSMSEQLTEEMNDLPKFVDTESYYFYSMFVVRNQTIPYGMQADVEFYDTDNNLLEGSEERMFMTVSTLKSQLPNDTYIDPNYLSDNDTVLLCATKRIICSPKDHIHTSGAKAYDIFEHYELCKTCGKKMLDTVYTHSESSYKGREHWYVDKQPTNTTDGRWYKKCGGCNYEFDSLTIPKRSNQIIVKSYDELKAALAKGGKQWITINFTNSYNGYEVIEDSKRNNELCLDDPKAEITINMNNFKISRETLYDDCLFNIKRGSLRILQFDTSSLNDNNTTFSFFSGNNNRCIFNVAKGASLRLSNISGVARSTEFYYDFPCVISKGNLQIDGGIYTTYTEKPAINITGGNVTINGGKFEATSKGPVIGTLVKNAYENDYKNITINNGLFGGLYNAVVFDEYTTATINQGNFEYDDYYERKQAFGVVANGGKLTINGGNYYATKAAVETTNMQSFNINGGYFRLFDENNYNFEGAVCIKTTLDSDYLPVISGGTYVGSYGITFLQKPKITDQWLARRVDFSNVISSKCKVYDDEKKVDINIVSNSLGKKYLQIIAPNPVITTQPTDGYSPNLGDTVTFDINATNADTYKWHIIDENGKEIDWLYILTNGYGELSTSFGGKKLFITKVSDWLNGKQIYCDAISGNNTVHSNIVNIKIDKKLKYMNDIYFDNFDEMCNNKTIGDYKKPKTSENALYTIGEVEWAKYGKRLDDSYKISIGEKLSLALEIIPKSGYELNNNIYGRVNGIDSVGTLKRANGKRYMIFDINVSVPDKYKTQNIEVNIKAPTVGAAPAKTASCVAGNVNINKIEWSPTDSKFISNKSYTVKIEVTPIYGWGDIETVTAKVNGNNAKFIKEGGGKNKKYYISYTFDKPSDVLLGDIDCNGTLSILDVTLGQRHLTGDVVLSETQKQAADINCDGKINVNDMTQIQIAISNGVGL